MEDAAVQNMVRLEFVADEADCDPVQGVLARMATSGWEEESLPTGETLFRVHCETGGFADDLVAEARLFAPNVRVERGLAPRKDWQSAWREFFTPVACGRFVVLPPWLANTPQTGRPIVIDPKSAFGTGHHESTVLCLKALSLLLDEGRFAEGGEFFDLGTGSGVLGIACAMSGLAGEGADIDPLAVDNATENAAINGVSGAFSVQGGSVERAKGRSFDLVLANILAGPLREMAPRIVGLLRPGGALILSGILEIQAESVMQAYAALGRPRVLKANEWVALIWG